ncbi:unnamed protein product [Protopolystoma xenopodis]|uniref:Uncharacterized protein n=1 Tax=Protopolystoma xenopodis TaxID=117903 RepID=A0A3S5CIS0_9PLAT|nr:unnamed protein product [Protopolystoma xenopodis]
MTYESLAPFHRNRRRLPRKQRQHESSSKANRQLVKRNPSLVVFWWNRHSNLFTQHFHSNSVAGRLLVEPTFESLHPTLPLEMERRVF